MKSAVLASLLFGSLAMAAPLNKRDVKTETVVETVVVYTTVYDTGAAEPTSMGLFYEKPSNGEPGAPGQPGQPGQPGAPGSAAATTTVQAPVETPAAAQPTTTTQAAQVAPAAEPAQPTTTEQAQQAAPTTTAQAAPAQSTPTTESKPASGSSGEQFSNVDITIYDNNGGFGACGTELHDSDMIVALAKDAWGASTYDVMTGAATNPWCGQKINIDYNGNSIQATIMDLCPGCSGHDIDLSLSAWKALTGLDEKTRLKASWSKAS